MVWSSRREGNGLSTAIRRRTLAAVPIKLELPKFTEAMNKSRRTGPLPAMTAWRYSSGLFPDAVYWLMLDPKLLRALAQDAESLSPEQIAALEASVYARKPRGRNKPKAKK